MRQKDLAELIHVDRSSVSKWENGLSYPSPFRIVQLAKVLKISEREIIQTIAHSRQEVNRIENNA